MTDRMKQGDPWAKYDADLKDQLRNNRRITETIIRMRDQGDSKEKAQRVVGVPYEIVDMIYNEKANKRSRDPRDDVEE